MVLNESFQLNQLAILNKLFAVKHGQQRIDTALDLLFILEAVFGDELAKVRTEYQEDQEALDNVLEHEVA